MSATSFSEETFLSAGSMDSLGTELCSDEDSDGNVRSGIHWTDPNYTGTVDYRIRQLSYSSLLTLHTCPRKFQLYKLRSTHRTEESQKSTVTFAFGHVVGEGIQLLLAGATLSEVLWQMFQSWHTDLEARDEKLNKSFYSAVQAIKRFDSLRAAGFLQDYELVYYNGKPATELSFAIVFPDGFRLRGFVDAVLRHTQTGKVIVLELKTTGNSVVNPATYKNSAQAIGYSIVLDHIFPDLSSYEVLYLVYQTKSGEYTQLPFTKTYLQRALWIKELLLDIETIKLYDAEGIYPMHGESCFDFFRECEYLQTCTLSTEFLTKKMTEAEVDTEEYQIVITLADLLNSQLGKMEA